MSGDLHTSNLPAIRELAALGPRFVHWRLEPGENGRLTKVPYRPRGQGKLKAASDNSVTWDTFDVACDLLDGTGCDGIGFVPRASEDGILVIDLDGCINPETGEIADWAERWVESLDSYTELSPSRTGLKVYVRAESVPQFARNTVIVMDAPRLCAKDPEIEILGVSNRYTTVTGQHYGSTPTEIRDATDALCELAEWIAQAVRGASTANGHNPAQGSALWTPELLMRAADVIPNTGRDLTWNEWNNVGMRMWAATGGSEAGRDAFVAFSVKSEKCSSGGRTARERWAGITRSPPTSYNEQSLLIHARHFDPEFPNPFHQAPPDCEFPLLNGQAASQAQAAPHAEPAWPDPLGEAAYHGLAGEVARTIEPHTESAPEMLLVSFLVGFGNSLGRGPHVKVEGSKHATNEFVLFIGESSKARKGTGWKRTLQAFEAAEAAATLEGIDLSDGGSWLADCVTHGLSSGEGLIHQVRDKQFKREAVRDKRTKEVTHYVEVEVDEGVADKRLMVVEEEFAATLRIMTRDGNSLSSIIRQAWDNGNLKTLTKAFSSVTTGALISLVGHCTVDELRRYLDRTELSNGFANRLMFVCVKRSKCLPFGGEDLDLGELGAKVREAQMHASSIDQVCWTDAAREIWADVYPSLSEGQPGLFGAMTSRGEAHVLRLALLYALTDHSAFIEPQHLEAALELWRYCWQSARFVFGDSLGDPLADEILRNLRDAPNGMTRTEISKLFGGHRDGAQLTRALAALAARGLAAVTKEAGSGRSVERWRST